MKTIEKGAEAMLLRSCVPLLALIITGDHRFIQLHVNVVDSEGVAIARAAVIVHPDPSGRVKTKVLSQDRTLSTNRDGEFSMQLEPGFYDLFVAAPGFDPVAKLIRITDKNISFTVKLSASREIIGAVGDKF